MAVKIPRTQWEREAQAGELAWHTQHPIRLTPEDLLGMVDAAGLEVDEHDERPPFGSSGRSIAVWCR